MILEYSGRFIDNKKNVIFTSSETDNYLRVWDRATGLVITITRTDIIISYLKDESTFTVAVWNKDEWDNKPCTMFNVNNIPFEIQVCPSGINGMNIYLWVYNSQYFTIQYQLNSVIIRDK